MTNPHVCRERCVTTLNGETLDDRSCELPAGHEGPHRNAMVSWSLGNENSECEEPGIPANLVAQNYRITAAESNDLRETMINIAHRCAEMHRNAANTSWNYFGNKALREKAEALALEYERMAIGFANCEVAR